MTDGPVPPGSNLLVEFDATSQWNNAHTTIAADWLKAKGGVSYHIASQPKERVHTQLKRLGLQNVEELEEPHERRALALYDWYTASLGRKVPDDDFSFYSLKIADLSIIWGKGEKDAEATGFFDQIGQPILRIVDNVSCLGRFNEEKAWVEFLLNRVIPRAQRWNQITIIGLTRSLHSDWVYKTLEGAADGVIDFKLDDTGEETKDMMRIRSMRNVGFDRKWHTLKVDKDFRVSLE